MAEYNIDEFIGNGEPTTFEDEVEKKVSLLYDFHILLTNGRRQRLDKREEAVRNLLKSYGSSVIMDNKVHDLLVGRSRLDDVLKQKEGQQ
jgi:hypothetical protein